jgi:hypothetical protein
VPEATGAGGAAAITAAAFIVLGCVGARWRVRQAGGLVGKWEQRIALGAAQAAAGLLAQEKRDETENEAKTDREGEGNDGHGDGELGL